MYTVKLWMLALGVPLVRSACPAGDGTTVDQPWRGTEVWLKEGGKLGSPPDPWVAGTEEDAGRKRINNGCKVYYSMLKGDKVHFTMMRDIVGSSFMVNWEAQGATPVVLLAWKAHGTPYVDVGGRGQRYDERIQDLLLMDNIDYKTKRLEAQGTGDFDFFHCAATCSGFHKDGHDNEDLYITLDTQFTGGALTQFKGWYQFTFYENMGKMESDQFKAIYDMFIKVCQPYRNGTSSPEAEWKGEVSLRNYLISNPADPDEMPYCWWQRKGMQKSAMEGNLGKTGIAGTCAQIDNIHCHSDGRVADVLLIGFGLRGPIPQGDLAALKGCTKIHLGQNRLSGPIPSSFEDHDLLVELDLNHNFLNGQIPCFSGDPMLDLILSFNLFEGKIPLCLSEIVKLQHLKLTGNSLTGNIPKELKELPDLATLALNKNMLTGGVPAEICRKNSPMELLDVSMNRLSGPLPVVCLENLYRLKSFDVAYNQFTGSLPVVKSDLKRLLEIDLSHNFLVGEFKNQFANFFANLKLQGHSASEASALWLNHNTLSGELSKEYLYTIMIKASAIGNLGLHGNRFRCDKEGAYPEWYYRVPHATNLGVAGLCLPIPVIQSVTPSSGYKGTQIEVKGKEFVRNASPRCKFSGGGLGAAGVKVPAAMAGISEQGTASALICYVSSDIPEGKYELQLSNFGEDWGSSATLKSYSAKYFEVMAIPEDASVLVKVSGTLLLTGMASDFYEPAFKAGMADKMGILPKQVQVTKAEKTGRRLLETEDRRLADALQTWQITFTIFCDNPDDGHAKLSKVQEIQSSGDLKQGLATQKLTCESLAWSGEPEVKGISTYEDAHTETILAMSAPAIICLIIGASACCGFCSFVFFLYRREKAGRPFFDALDEEDDDDAGAKKKKKGHFAQADEASASASKESPSKSAD